LGLFHALPPAVLGLSLDHVFSLLSVLRLTDFLCAVIYLNHLLVDVEKKERRMQTSAIRNLI